MKYALLAGLLCAGTVGFAQSPGKKPPAAVPAQAANGVYSVAASTASPAGSLVDTSYLSSSDFSGTGTVSDPIRIKTSVIQAWLQSLPGYAPGGNRYLASDFTWKTIPATSLSPLAAPALTATVVSPAAISLSWTDVVNETGYLLQRSQDSASWVTVTNTAANATQFTNSGLAPSTFYYYRVKALGDNVSYSDGPFGWASKSTPSDGGAVVSPETVLFDVANAYQVQQHPDGPGTYYSRQGSGLAKAVKKIAAGSDGLVYFQYLAGTSEFLSLGYTPANTLQGNEHWMGGLILTDNEVKAYGYNGSTTGLGVAPVNNRYYGFRRNGSAVEIVTSTDAATWTVLGRANYSPANLYIQVYFQTPDEKIKAMGQNLVSY